MCPCCHGRMHCTGGACHTCTCTRPAGSGASHSICSSFVELRLKSPSLFDLDKACLPLCGTGNAFDTSSGPVWWCLLCMAKRITGAHAKTHIYHGLSSRHDSKQFHMPFPCRNKFVPSPTWDFQPAFVICSLPWS